jgi:hypothetical protein
VARSFFSKNAGELRLILLSKKKKGSESTRIQGLLMAATSKAEPTPWKNDDEEGVEATAGLREKQA